MSTVRRRLRVGVLVYGLDRPLSGVTRTALELGRALHHEGRCELVYLTPYRRGPFRGAPGHASWYLPGCARLPGLMVLGGPLIALAARRLDLDLVHDPVGIAPFTLGRWAGRFAKIVTIHDAIAFRRPEGYPWLNNVLHRKYVPATLRHTDAVISVSEHAGADVRRFYGLAPTRMHVVPNGVAGHFQPALRGSRDHIADRYGLRSPFVLTVGAPQARKNLERLVTAFASIRAEHPTLRLAIAGPRLWRYDRLRQQVSSLGLEEAISVLGYVADTDLPALYSAASVFVFPSLDEGFGLPVLEAMACGTPVVCSNATSLPEVTGDAALLVDPTDCADIATAMRWVLSDRALRNELRRRGLDQARRFTWERTAAKTVDVYEHVVRELGL